MSSHDETMAALEAFYKPMADLADEKTANAEAAFCGWKEIHSSAAKVHPSQIDEATANAKKHGVPTNFDEKGRPVFTSRSHRKNYCEKLRGLHDMDGGYGDPKSTVVWD